MGFGFLKKKKKKAEAETPIPDSTRNSEEHIDDIPLPPKKDNRENPLSEPESMDSSSPDPVPPGELTPNPYQEPENPEHLGAGMMDQSAEDKGESLPQEQSEAPLSKEQEVEDMFKKPGEKTELKQENTDDELDFSLPDFSDEELNIKELQQDEEEPEPEDLPEEDKETEKTASITGEEKDEKGEEEEPIESVPRELPEKVEKDRFLELQTCKRIYAGIANVQERIEDCQKTGQKMDNLQKNVLQNHQTLHDELDIIQEKLMEIDRTLFEG